MDMQHWLRELRAELARRKLPPLYVERFVLEMSDHFTDYMEDRMSMDAKDLPSVLDQFGSPGHVAVTAAHEYRKARFSRRHPVLMFVLLPVIALPLLWMGLLALTIFSLKLLGLETGKVSSSDALWQAASVALPYVNLLLRVLPLVLIAIFCIQLASRAEVGWKWPLVACVLLSVIGGAAMSQLALPSETGPGSLSIGFGFSAQPSASQLLQFILPLAIGGWAIWRQLSRRGSFMRQA